MKRMLVMGALAASFVLGSVVPAQAGPGIPTPGGQCEDPVDFICRDFVCGPDDLDCGMIPPCLIWVRGACRL